MNMPDSHDNNVTYLITGANRGLGFGFAATFLSRPNTTVIAFVRDPAHPTSQSLLSLPRGDGSSLQVLGLTNTSTTEAIAEALAGLPLTRIDVVIANAAQATHTGALADLPVSVLMEHVAANAGGTLALFQATKDLLRSAGERGGRPRFVALTSPLGTIGGMESVIDEGFDYAAYGASKATLNFIVRRLHFEEKWLCAMLVDPGFVQTAMGNEAAEQIGLPQAILTVEMSVSGLVVQIDKAKREEMSGKVVAWTEGRSYEF